MNPLPQLPKLPPGADVVFRRLFNEDNGCRLLISLLNAILGYKKGRRIRTLTLLRTHLAGPLHGDKEVILDVRAKAENGRVFHIEVQVCFKLHYRERILFYWSGLYRDQMSTGEGYGDLRQVTSVHILFFRLFKDERHAAYHHVFRAIADGDGPVLSPHFEIHTIEMPKFKEAPRGTTGKKWLYWLKYGDKMTQEEVEQLGMPEIIEAERKLEMISQDRELRYEILRRQMAHHDEVSLKQDSMNKGLRKGLREGKRKGLDEGLRKGLEEGLRVAIVDTCEVLGLSIAPNQKARLDAMGLPELEALRLHLKQHRSWPAI